MFSMVTPEDQHSFFHSRKPKEFQPMKALADCGTEELSAGRLPFMFLTRGGWYPNLLRAD